jgi:hypothetical protein
MQNIELTAEEKDVLAEFLQTQIRELGIEVGRTDTHLFKEKLKHRRQVLEILLEKLSGRAVAVQGG